MSYPAQAPGYPAQPPYPAYADPNAAKYAAPATNSTVVVQSPPDVVYVGGCPSCRVGRLEDDFGCCAIFLAICFFPLGVLCCLAMRQRRCTNCGSVFD